LLDRVTAAVRAERRAPCGRRQVADHDMDQDRRELGRGVQRLLEAGARGLLLGAVRSRRLMLLWRARPGLVERQSQPGVAAAGLVIARQAVPGLHLFVAYYAVACELIELVNVPGDAQSGPALRRRLQHPARGRQHWRVHARRGGVRRGWGDGDGLVTRPRGVCMCGRSTENLCMRMNIWVPDELKARMDEVQHVNWSAIAQRAFEIEVNVARWKMVENEEERVVERLRASKLREDEAEQIAGREAGQEWAQATAEYGELRRVANYEHWGVTRDEDYPSTLASLILNVDDWREIDASDVRDLWQQLRDREDEPDAAWVEGFVEGATEVWDEVADKV
jgi:hypothetical protein